MVIYLVDGSVAGGTRRAGKMATRRMRNGIYGAYGGAWRVLGGGWHVCMGESYGWIVRLSRHMPRITPHNTP